jgi:bacterioferritin-associated ferredoxin
MYICICNAITDKDLDSICYDEIQNESFSNQAETIWEVITENLNLDLMGASSLPLKRKKCTNSQNKSCGSCKNEIQEYLMTKKKNCKIAV